jgi:hypothetical protein
LISAQWFPERGLMLRRNQKLPKLVFFRSKFEPIYSYQIFATKNVENEIKILSAMKIHEDKKKKIKTIINTLQEDFSLIQITNAAIVEQGS